MRTSNEHKWSEHAAQLNMTVALEHLQYHQDTPNFHFPLYTKIPHQDAHPDDSLSPLQSQYVPSYAAYSHHTFVPSLLLSSLHDAPQEPCPHTMVAVYYVPSPSPPLPFPSRWALGCIFNKADAYSR